ncbi:MAG: hypothetical protein EBU90_00455 [Proteobacteria bacterium]|nr:hypothetical protein [Pseudomonadota bacterium]NBP12902.1 hypothetical protein [bacterium]
MFALFNTDKTFIGYSPDIPENSNILKKEIPEEQSDVTLWRWDGDYDSGRMVPVDIGYPIEEIELERQLFDYISKEYPINVQMLKIIKQLRRIVQDNDQLQEDGFMDMSDCIISAVDKYHKRVNYYRNYAKLIPKHESEQQFNSAFGK